MELKLWIGDLVIWWLGRRAEATVLEFCTVENRGGEVAAVAVQRKVGTGMVMGCEGTVVLIVKPWFELLVCEV
jgi:hypothetical protein